jgi:hypothetical protein
MRDGTSCAQNSRYLRPLWPILRPAGKYRADRTSGGVGACGHPDLDLIGLSATKTRPSTTLRFLHSLVESGGRASLTVYCASVSPSMRCVSPIVRQRRSLATLLGRNRSNG